MVVHGMLRARRLAPAAVGAVAVAQAKATAEHDEAGRITGLTSPLTTPAVVYLLFKGPRGVIFWDLPATASGA